MHILGLSGSLRSASLHRALLRAAAETAPEGIELAVYDSLGALPLFNPDDEATAPPVVARLCAALVTADAVLIASPEYAHGVTGTLKNALDWMVGTEAFVEKPVALLSASPRYVHAPASLREILITMSAHWVDAACLTLPVLGTGLDEQGIMARPDFVGALRNQLAILRAAVRPAERDGR
ncbi:FMN reductase [Halothiobacillus diazotrophicus]|uniref:FMN reductase n=1 Tax=Halothiobacillus diazotrophicus TaxID=1860122 RepID=A0A191ZHS4_9GAMM|nr:NADPH-dependent FMN reductase [Halothiobacillus diazotrophicus]ANJ67434.1 FMN reductase [Halothiobacillus diazotrophicus]